MTSGRGTIFGDAIEGEGEITITAAVEEEDYLQYPSPSFLGNDDDEDDGECMANVYHMDLVDAYNNNDVDFDVDIDNADIRNAIYVHIRIGGDNKGSRGGTRKTAAAGGGGRWIWRRRCHHQGRGG